MLTSHKRLSDPIRQRFNKCTVYKSNGSGAIKKGQKEQFAKAWPIQELLYQNIDNPRE